MTLYLVAAAAILLCAVFLVFHCQYEDGVIGRAALAVLALAELIVLMEWYHEGQAYEVLPTTYAVQIAVALFMLRHVYRFLRWRHSNAHRWRPARK